MDRPSSPYERMQAPSAYGTAGGAYAPGAGQRLPGLSEHLVKPEVTRDEVVRGVRMVARPANPEHADCHFGLDYVLRAHVKTGYVGSTDMITRFTHQSDFATDSSIRKAGKDPATGERYLEEIAFEIANSQTGPQLKVRAEDVTSRGVRRFFAIFVKKRRIAEWSAEDGDFRDLDLDTKIEDPTLASPITVRSLLDAAAADDDVARALLHKKNPVLEAVQEQQLQKGIEEGLEQGVEQGILKGKASALLAVLSARGLAPTRAERQSITACTSARKLDRWLKKAAVATSVTEVLTPEKSRRA
ncbi:MAG: hypothetical protein R3B70_04130 [Polyangiaceae bacterium]